MIDAFLKAIAPDKMLVIPNAQPPHKEISHLATEEDRLTMLELALADRACHIDRRELLRSGKSYTFETLRSLREEYPKDRFVLLVGADSLLSFEKWVHFEEILNQTELAVFERGGISGGEDEPLRKEAKRLEEKYGAKISLIEARIPSVSSTIVRQRAAAGMDLSDLVSPLVGEYLKKKNLYLDPAKECLRNQPARCRKSGKKGAFSQKSLSFPVCGKDGRAIGRSSRHRPGVGCCCRLSARSLQGRERRKYLAKGR